MPLLIYLSILTLLTATVALPCTLSSTLVDDLPAQNLGYALQNVTCPVNTGAIQLQDSGNVSSILDYADAVAPTIRDTITYLKANAPNGSVLERQNIFYGADALDIPFQFAQWTDILVLFKQQIVSQKISQALVQDLMDTKAALQDFITMAVATVESSEKTDLSNTLSPALGDLDCAINQLNSNAPATLCSSILGITDFAPAQTAMASSTNTGISQTSTTPSTSIPQTVTVTAATSSPTSTHSGTNDLKTSVELLLTAFCFTLRLFF